MIQLILLIGLVLLAVHAARRFFGTASAGTMRKFRRLLLWCGLGVVLLLAATGRLAILLPVLGVLLVTLLRFLLVLAPMLVQYLPHWQRFQRGQAYGARQTATGANGNADVSTVESAFLRMQLDHATGEIAGEVLKGRHAGRQLSALGLEQLGSLYVDYTRGDPESATLLRAYLDRVYGEAWEEQGTAPGKSPAEGKMTSEEAYRILGLSPGATRDAIVGAHRRLMQKLHPDRGGSDYLAAKINQAKDLLLGR